MKVAVFSAEPYDRQFLEAANRAAAANYEWVYFETRLEVNTAPLASGFEVICAFVNDDLGGEVLQLLADGGTRLVALRSTGYNNVDLQAAANLGIKITRVADYSPYSVAEHAVGLMLMLNRKLYKAYNRVRDDNFALNGLLGFDLYNCTVGIIGTGRIGVILGQIMRGFGCQILGYDPYPSPKFQEIEGARYVELPKLYAQSDIISLHCPLTPANHYLIDAQAIAQMKPGVMLINTSRGPLIDTKSAIAGIKSGKIGYLGIDVYEDEEQLFFRDLSNTTIQDDTFQLLQSFPNVVITAHQAFFTRNALETIAQTTVANLQEFEQGSPLSNEVRPH
ncbi:MAG: 2-hydroxyacid dehydrogenase [Chloroflexaceae bacterium]|nr:2-hydroxyacid dehydrogenase [Chloroflexaceae bacterium]